MRYPSKTSSIYIWQLSPPRQRIKNILLPCKKQSSLSTNYPSHPSNCIRMRMERPDRPGMRARAQCVCARAGAGDRSRSALTHFDFSWRPPKRPVSERTGSLYNPRGIATLFCGRARAFRFAALFWIFFF